MLIFYLFEALVSVGSIAIPFIIIFKVIIATKRSLRSNSDNDKIDNSEPVTKPRYVRCEYCECRVSIKNETCPHCGARLNKKNIIE